MKEMPYVFNLFFWTFIYHMPGTEHRHVKILFLNIQATTSPMSLTCSFPIPVSKTHMIFACREHVGQDM